MSGGLGGLAFVGVGGALLIAERTAAHTAAVERQLMQLVDLLTEPIEPVEPGLVAVPGGQWYHRPDCQLARDKPGVQALTPAEIAKQGLTPCPVCAPQLSAPPPVRAPAIRAAAIRAAAGHRDRTTRRRDLSRGAHAESRSGRAWPSARSPRCPGSGCSSPTGRPASSTSPTAPSR